MLPHFEKILRILTKSHNPSSIDLLRFLLNDLERDIREKAFEGLYSKKKPEIMLELFHQVAQNEGQWREVAFLNSERMSRLAEEAIRSGAFELAKMGCEMAIRNNLYETLQSITSMINVPRPDWVDYAARMLLKLATCFYDELANADSNLERRNMDRRREWFAAQLEDPVRRFPIHGRIEPVKAFLLVVKKNNPFLQGLFGDIHSMVCKTVIDLLQNSEDVSYYRLLLGFINDGNAPPVIDSVLTSKEDKKFIHNLLRTVGENPAQTTKDALKRFKGFRWIAPDNEAIPDLIAGEEACFVQLIANSTMPRETILAMLDLVFKLPSVKGRRAAIKAIRAFNGDDVNHILITATNDSDPEVCSEAIRVMKAKRVKEVDQIIMQKYDHPSEKVRDTIYELMPEFRIDSFFQRIGQVTDNMARIIGRIVRRIDPNVQKRINEEIASAIPVRRRMAIDAMCYTNLAPDYEETLIHLADNDDEVEVRIAACMALAHVLTKDSWQTLQHAAASRNLAVQQAGNEASNKWKINLEQYQKETVPCS